MHRALVEFCTAQRSVLVTSAFFKCSPLYKEYDRECSDCYNRYYRSVGVIVRCLVLKQPDCMSLIVEASRSIFALDGPALYITAWQRTSITPDVHGKLAGSGCILSMCFVPSAQLWRTLATVSVTVTIVFSRNYTN